MKTLFRIVTGALCVLVLASLSFASVLSVQEKAKLHPQFQTVLVQTHPELGLVDAGIPLPAATAAGTGAAVYDAIVSVKDPSLVRLVGVTPLSTYPGFVTTRVTADQMIALAQLDGVTYLDPGSMNYPSNDIGTVETGATLVQGGYARGVPYKGAGAIVVIYDTGIDWKHLDFRSPSDPTKSRILAIWDQTLTPIAGETSPAGMGYGVEYTQAQINAELGGSPPGFVREADINGHGTHVAGTAAGNGLALNGKFAGMAPLADIIVVKGGNTGFSETNMINGLSYAMAKAVAVDKPAVVNYSIGGHSGPHDGSRAYEVAIQTEVNSASGHAVVVSAGNDGGTLMHVAGSAGATTTLTFTVPAYTANAGTGNDGFSFDLWFQGNPTVSATVTSPNGATATAANGVTASGSSTVDGTISLSNLSSYTANGHRYLQLIVTDASSVPASGNWNLVITNGGAAVPYDGWLWARTVGATSVTLGGADVNKTVSMPATSDGAITVGAYVTRWGWPSYIGANYVYGGTDRTSNIASFSSIGPTADGRQKPDIAGPGQGIASSLSSTSDTTGGLNVWVLPGQKHIIEQGTSMSAPHVTGAVALLLGAFPSTSALEIKSLLTSTANTDAFTGAVPNATWGYGKFDILRAMAKKISSSAVVTRTVFSYDGTSANATATLAGPVKYAVRFSPNVSGQLTGLTIMLTTENNRPVRGTGNVACEIFTNSGGVPGTKIGNTVLSPVQLMSSGTANYVQMLGAGVNVVSGTDYHAVVSMPSVSDTIILRSENVATGTRSSTFNGSTWAGVLTNHRIRAIVTTQSGLNSVGGMPELPLAYELGQNYPNPFNPSTRISYSLGESGPVTLRVFDILGRDIATLVNAPQNAGSYQIMWDGRDAAHRPVSSGVYFYRLESGSFTKTNKMVMLK
jgi:minor extracellular serine protease Vpr